MKPFCHPDRLQQLRSGRVQGRLWRGWPGSTPDTRIEPGVLFLELGQLPCLLGLHPAVLLPPAVIRRLSHFDDAANVGDGHGLVDQLLDGPLLLFEKASPTQKPFGLELADDLLRGVPVAFHGRVAGQVWPADGSHSKWIVCRGPRHYNRERHH